jgi:hypothetical protein
MWIVVSDKICLILRCQSWKYGGWNKSCHQEVHKCCHVLECHEVAGLCALCKKAGGTIGLCFQVQQEGEQPGNVTSLWLPALVLAHLNKSMCVHDQIGQRHCDSDVIIGSSLIDMYFECGSIEDASRLNIQQNGHA